MSSAPRPSERFGRYELVRLMGRGGMGEIWAARDTLLDRPVVIKRLRSHLSDNPAFVDMFLDEAQAAAKLAHPNVVKIYDLGMLDGTYFMAMERLYGWDLNEIRKQLHARGELLPVPVVLRLVIDACRGLHAAHTAKTDKGVPLKLVHRDVSPQNLFVTRDGILHVLDFGVAKSAIQRRQTMAGTIKGKVAYMSPEQALGEPLDARSDIFALAIVLHELVSGQRLFDRPVDVQVFDAVLTEPILPPMRRGAALPGSLVSATMRALQRDKTLRFDSAERFGDELEGVLRELGSSITARDVAVYLRERFGEPPSDEGDAAFVSASGSASVDSAGKPLKLSSGERTARDPDPGAYARESAGMIPQPGVTRLGEVARVAGLGHEGARTIEVSGVQPASPFEDVSDASRPASRPSTIVVRERGEVPTLSEISDGVTPKIPGRSPSVLDTVRAFAAQHQLALVGTVLVAIVLGALWVAREPDETLPAPPTPPYFKDPQVKLEGPSEVTAVAPTPTPTPTPAAPLPHTAEAAAVKSDVAPIAPSPQDNEAAPLDASAKSSVRSQRPRAAAKARVGARESGFLTIAVVPARDAEIFVDGASVGPAPLFGHEVASGRPIVVKVVWKRVGVSREHTLNVEPGKTLKHTFVLEKP